MKIAKQSPIQLRFYVSKSKGFKLANEVVDAFAEEWGLTRQQVLGPCRIPTFVQCRREIATHLRYSCGMSLPEIGATMNRDHSSIMHLLGLRTRKRDAT